MHEGAEGETIVVPIGAEGELIVVPEGVEAESIVVQEGAEGETIVIPESAGLPVMIWLKYIHFSLIKIKSNRSIPKIIKLIS